MRKKRESETVTSATTAGHSRTRCAGSWDPFNAPCAPTADMEDAAAPLLVGSGADALIAEVEA
jgi:hypothetical protein